MALETAKSSLIGSGVARAQYAHAIAVLVGKNPEELDIPHSTALPTLPTIPIGVPSTLLQRRPDIAAAERTMKAENAAIGVAVAAYYPTMSLSGAGASAAPLNGLLHAANHIWSLGATARRRCSTSGERRGAGGTRRLRRCGRELPRTVLTAFEDVENDLSGLGILAAGSRKEQQKTWPYKMLSVERRLRSPSLRPALWTITVALAQETALSDQQAALVVQQNRLLAAVALIGDIGGGWSEADLHKP